MFSDDDKKYLLRLIGKNRVVLFLGAGFSFDAKNKLQEPFPFGKNLAEKIWEFLGYDESYDGTNLQELYQAFVHAGIKKQEKTDFLRNNLLSGDIPDYYNFISQPYWYKIYTLNVDDVLDKIFGRTSRRIDVLKYPKDEYRERDQSLESTQIVYLNGKLPCDPEEIIFSKKQYAKANLTLQPLYAQFVYEYATLPIVFLGTQLDESIFETYIEARESRGQNLEKRPKSFLIAPSISPVRKDNLKNIYNVHFVEGTTSDFLEWINNNSNELPEKIEILRNTFPNLLKVKELDKENAVPSKSILEFSEAFRRVPVDYETSDKKSSFLLGTSPMWKDIFLDNDIPRSITNEIFDKINSLHDEQNEKFQFISIIGSAGSGKSTLLKRLGLRLAQNGRTTFLTYSEHIPRIDRISHVLNSINDQVVLLFDNANNAIGLLPTIIENFKSLKKLPIIVLTLRSNYRNKLNSRIDPDLINHSSYQLPNLDDVEITDLIAKLEENNLLGRLKGKTDTERFKEFKYRNKKQILVAMKETTNGRPFNEIIKNEYESIDSLEGKILCLCIALNTEIGFTNTKQDLIGFSKVDHVDALNILENELRGTIIYGSSNESFMLRHRVLADHFLKHCSEIIHVKEAYIRVLSVLAPELRSNHRVSRKFSLYRALINHRTLYYRFKENIDLAREVYDSISDFFTNDPHFWLQFGSLEIEGKGGNLIIAENYLSQAESLSPKDNYIQTAFCNLYYKMARAEEVFSHAYDYKQKADDLAKNLISRFGGADPHIYHIYCRGTYDFIKKWIKDPKIKKESLEELKKEISSAIGKHPRDTRLQTISNAIMRAYLHLGIDNDDLIDPEIPSKF